MPFLRIFSTLFCSYSIASALLLISHCIAFHFILNLDFDGILFFIFDKSNPKSFLVLFKMNEKVPAGTAIGRLFSGKWFFSVLYIFFSCKNLYKLALFYNFTCSGKNFFFMPNIKKLF
jgi:hypothetical protein